MTTKSTLSVVPASAAVLALVLALVAPSAAYAVTVTPDSGAIRAAAYEDTATTTLPTSVTVGGVSRAVTWPTVDTATPYVTRSATGTLDNGDTVAATVEVVPSDLVYFIDSGATSSVEFSAVQQLVGSSAALANTVPDKQYTGTASWGYDLNGTAGNKADWVAKTDSGSTKDQTGLYADDNPASYVLTLAKGKYSISIGAYEWWNSPGRKQNVSLVAPDGTTTSIASNVQLNKGAIVVSTAAIEAKTAGIYRVLFSQASGGYPVVSWLGVSKVASTTVAPVLTPASGTFTAAKTITISSATAGSDIFYTLDGSQPTTASTRYTGPFSLSQSAAIKAVAAVGDDVSAVSSAQLSIRAWGATATAFKLTGENAAANVKVTWDTVADATRYDVLRGTTRIATTTGDTIDDYGLASNATYTYTVKAFTNDALVSTTAPTQVRTFTPTGTPVVWDNTTGGNDLGEPTGVKVGNSYYRYATTSSNGTTKITEASSTDGRTFGAPRTLATLDNTKLEGFFSALNPATGKVVIAAHRENAADYDDAKLFLAEVTPGGALTVTFSDRPLGKDSRDMSVFIDTDGAAYVSSATNTNADIAIIRLNSSWTAPESLIATAFQGQGRETPKIIRKADTYYFFSSKASGWLPSQATYASATSLAGPWSELRELGNAATYGTQSTSVSAFGDDSYGLYGWRWGANWTPAESTGNYPRLLPVSFNAGFASMEYYSEVEYYSGTGLVPVQSGRLVSLDRPVSVSVDGASANNNQNVITDGADLAGSGFFRSGNEGAANAYPYDAVIDLGTANRVNEIDTTTFLYNGSEAAYKYTISGSLDGLNYSTIVDQSNNTRPGYLIDKVTSTKSFRYVKVTVTGATKMKDGGSVTGWGDGLYEVAVFGTPTGVPVVSVPAGRYYTTQNVALSSGDASAEIRYTLDGSTPTASSPRYTTPIELAAVGDYTVKAVAVSGSTVSDVLTAAYTILSGATPVSVAETPAYAVVPGQTPNLPSTIKVNTASGAVADAPVAWDLDGMTFTKPYKSYTIYGTVPGLPGYVTSSIETLATQTVYYVDSGTAGGTSSAYLGAKWLRGSELLNSASDQAKTSSTSWGYSGQDGLVADAGAKEVNGLYGKNNANNNVDYALTLPAGTYTAAFGIYEWWSAGDRQVRATVVDSKGRSIAVAQSAVGAITATNRSASLAGTFTVPADGGGAVTLRFTNVGYQGATVTWFGIAKGAQTLDLSRDVVQAPSISPTAASVYGKAQKITITAASGSVVYYTTDGSTPSRINGTKYADPFTLSSSAIVNAVAVANGVTSSVTAADYSIVVQEGDYTSVPVGSPWFDTDRSSIQAHGGGFLQYGGYYYWVGEDRTNNSASFGGVNLYRSQDLLNWEFVGQILKPDAAGLDCLAGGTVTCKLERPKLLYNASTDTFVLWGHWETAADYGSSQVVVATSTTINGNYGVLYHGRPGVGQVWDLDQQNAINATITAGTYPDFTTAAAAYRANGNTPSGYQSRDFTVYVDAGGKGWLISAEANVQLRIYPLSSDFTQADYAASYPLFTGQAREAAAITQVNGVYYLINSGQSGWYANQLKYASTTDLSDPNSWSANTNVGNNTGFKSQPTALLQLQKADGSSSVVYVGDRWAPDALAKSTYVWLPVKINTDVRSMTLEYTDNWSFNAATGEITNNSPQLVSQGKPASATPTGTLSDGYNDSVSDPGENAGISPAAAANDGISYNTTPYDNSHYFYPGTTSNYTWQVDLGTVDRLSRADISWRSYNGSETYSGYLLAGSNDGATWTTIVDRSNNRTVGFTSDHVSGDFRYFRVTVNKVTNDHNGADASWASGLVEVQVYGTPLPQAVTITGASSVSRGATSELLATVAPTGADQSVDWSSSDTSIATVDGTGTVHGVAAGTVVITATSAVDHTITAALTLNVLPVKPAAPASRSAAAASDTSIKVTWTAPSDNGGAAVTAYRVYEAGATSPLGEVPAGVTTYTAAGLQLGSSHRYEIAAVNAVGEGLRTVPTVAVLLPEVSSNDGAKAKPAQGVLSSNDGWDTGLRDGTFQVTMNLWYGENGSLFKLYRDGTLVGTVPLTMASPNAQKAVLDIAGLKNGTYQFTGVLINSKGSTATQSLTAVVTDASPGTPVLSSDNWDNDGNFVVTANLWWGTNATSYRFLENGTVVSTGALTSATPSSQVAKLTVAGRAKGSYTYTVEFINTAGKTVSTPLVVKVTK